MAPTAFPPTSNRFAARRVILPTGVRPLFARLHSIVNRSRLGRHLATIAAVLVTALPTLPAHAAPFVPADDAQVLERLPYRTAPAFRDLQALKAAAARAPRELAPALALATAYVRASRVEGDPRFLGYAQAALKPWWSDPGAPTAVLLLRASILQTSHQFDAAVVDLDTVLSRDPGNAQALLTRATVLTVQARYDPARADCLRLGASAPRVYAVVCTAAIDAMTGRDDAARESIRAALASTRVDAAARGWAETLLGEIAHRRGDDDAEAQFQAALAADDGDLYALAAYADWLLDQHRAADVVALLRERTRVDILLLRLAIAQQALRLPEAATSVETLRARFDASHARGDTVHLRENARFELALRGDAAAALRYAKDNQRVQREAADLRVLAEAAAAAGDAAALAMARRWIDDTGLNYAAVRTIVDSSGMRVRGVARAP
jgi:Tfp pilus assembly protein PilF